VFVTVSHFHPNLIFASWARSLPLELNPNEWLNSGRLLPAHNYKIRLKPTDNEKHSSLLLYSTYYFRKQFLVQGTSRKDLFGEKRPSLFQPTISDEDKVFVRLSPGLADDFGLGVGSSIAGGGLRSIS